MNFYSEDIFNNIIDNGEIETILPQIQICMKIFTIYFVITHTKSFVQSIFNDYYEDDTNKIAFRCIDMEFSIENCPSILIYHRHYNKATNELIYYILMICTKPKFKKFGYASKLLDDFIQHIKNKHCDSAFKIKIVLSSVESAVTFYESYGFKWTRESLTDHKTLLLYEKWEEGKEYFILELVLN